MDSMQGGCCTAQHLQKLINTSKEADREVRGNSDNDRREEKIDKGERDRENDRDKKIRQ